MISKLPAKYNDDLIRKAAETSKSGIHLFAEKALSKAVSLAVFPLFAGIDLAYHLAKAPIETGRAVLLRDPHLKSENLDQAKSSLAKARKCFFGLLATPASFVVPDIVTREFIPVARKDQEIASGGKFYTAPGEEKHPASKEEIVSLINQAIDEGKTVSISGAHMSQNKDTLPMDDNSISINMRNLNGVTIDPERKVAIVEAGATWKEVQQEANKHQLAVKVMQASNIFTVGGSLGVNCHGWDFRTGTISETVKAVTIVNAKGELQRLDPDVEEDRELFGLVIGGHGLFGVIVEAEIDLSDNHVLRSWGEAVDPEHYVDYFYDKIHDNEDHVMHKFHLSLDPKNLLKEGIAVTYSRKERMPDTESSNVSSFSNNPDDVSNSTASVHPAETTESSLSEIPAGPQGSSHSINPAEASESSTIKPADRWETTVSQLIDEPERGTLKERILLHFARNFKAMRSLYWKQEKKRLDGKETEITQNEAMRAKVNAAFNPSRADAEWLQEYFVKPDELAPFLDALSKILTENDVTLLNATVRYVKKDEKTEFAYAPDGDRFAVVLCFNQSLASSEISKTQAWVRKVIEYLNDTGGIYYLPYQHFATEEQFKACYPQFEGIAELKDAYDPQRTFSNGFYRDYLQTLDTPPSDEPP